MAIYHDLVDDFSLTADVDLTSGQYQFVTVASTAGRVKLGTGASNPYPLGVLQNSPSAGDPARIRWIGITKMLGGANSSCPITYGRFFSASGAKATATASETGDVALGRWLDVTIAVSTSNYGMAFINCVGFGACPLSAS
jgi:hypothetical protein